MPACRSLLVCWIAVSAALPAMAATFYLDPAKTDAPNCGTSAAAACRTYRYWFASGCDGNGCGRNVAAGDTISFAPGTYNGDGASGNLGIPFDGSAVAPVTLACSGVAGSCIIDGTNVTAINFCALVGIGLAAGSPFCAGDAASYVVLQGFTIRRPPAGMNALAFASPSSHHLAVKNSTIDGTGASANLVAANPSIHHLTLLDNTITNCPASSSGCTWFDRNANVAVVGNALGPVSTAGNNDCNTFISVNTGLVDGNTCRDTFDGFDEGMNTADKLDRVIVRFNRVSGTNTGRAFPLSGNIEGPNGTDVTGNNVLYKNVVDNSSGRCFELYGGADRIGVWYNTCFAGAGSGWGDALWLDAQFGTWVENVRVAYNIFDSASTTSNPLLVLDQRNDSVKGCPSGAPCALVGNGVWMGERGADGSCIYWDPTDAPQRSYTCGAMAQFNAEVPQQSGNFRADPRFVNRSQPTVLNNLKLTGASAAYLDAGDSFCRASAAGSGNTVAVTCQAPLSDARYYFPDPTAFYALANDDCKGRGTRPSDAIDSGCYDIQIEGACGVRTLTGVGATSVSFSGPPCSWSTGAMVHVPWSGSAPDLGALEFASAAAPPPAPLFISVRQLP